MTVSLDQLTDSSGLARRAFTAHEVRAAQAQDGTRTVTGIGVPYGEIFETSWFRERFEPGAIEDDSAALAFFEHRTPIGKLTASRDTDAGREVTLKLSRTTAADEAYQLAQDDVIRSMSIGFVPVEYREEHTEDDERPLIVHTKVRVKEYSLVAFPAYQDAQISSIRSAHTSTPPKETPVTIDSPDTVSRSELDAATGALTDQLEDLQRSMAQMVPGPGADNLETRADDWSQMGEWVQAVADEGHARHDEAVTLYRDITTSDVPSKLITLPGFIGDLSKRVTERRRWLNRFRTRPLPAKGMTVDYIRTDVTATVEEQVNELDVLAKGAAFSVSSDSSKVRTFGGAETVSRQVIDRSEAWALTGMFEAFAMQYARVTEQATKTYIVSKINEILAGGVPGNTVEVPAEFGAFDWIDAIVDSAGTFEDRGYLLKELAVSKDVFKRLALEAGTDGRPLLTVSGTGVNVVGSMNLPAASGELMRVPVTLLHGAADGTALFYDDVAIETLESPGAPFWLQQDQVLNLSRDYACYGYLAHITPHPGALLPVKFTTAGA